MSIFRPPLAGMWAPPVGESLDPDAAAYIALVKAAGVDDAHLASIGLPSWKAISQALNAWFEGEKYALRWGSIRRCYFRIWGNHVANSICMRTLGSSSFVGGVTHSGGYVEGNGTSGYFRYGASGLSIGLSATSGAIFAGCMTSGAGLVGEYNFSIDSGGSGRRLQWGASKPSTSATPTGIFLGTRNSGTTTLYRRSSSGFSAIASNSTAPGAVYASEMIALAWNNGGGTIIPVYYSTGRQFVDGVLDVGMDSSSAGAFTLSLKTLWETCTGLTLP